MNTVIFVEHLSKTYRLGQVGSGTFTNDMKLWWAKLRGKPNPLLKIGEADHGNREGEELIALRDVSFTVQQGEVLGIIGRNGAGKSTLLKILSRVTAPTSGKIKVKGRIASLLEVGTGFHPELTGRENIYLNGAILGMTRQEVTRKFDEIVDFAEVEKFIDTPVKRYSSGMYVRLAFAVAAHLEPEILVVDEVLAVGDAAFQKKCLGKMGDVAKGGRTVLFVSHNMVAIEQLCQQCILLSTGSLEQSGTADNVIEYYLNRADNSSHGMFKEITGLQGQFFIKLIDFCFSSVNKNDKRESKIIKAGDSLKIYMNFFTDIDIQNIRIGIGINNNRNYRVATLHNEISGFQISLSKGNNDVICAIPTANLVEGAYSVDIKVYSGRETVLFAQNFYQFDIQPGNLYNSGKLPDSSWGGVCYLPQQWKAANNVAK